MVHICEICNKEFKSVSNLYSHQRTAKYCLEKAKGLVCKYCNNIAPDPNHLDVCLHYKIYKLKLELDETQIKYEVMCKKCTDLEEKLQQEQQFKDDLLVKSATKPINKINNNNYNLSVTIFPPEEEVRRKWEDIICYDLLKGGIKEFVKAGHDIFLMKNGEPTVICVDPARNKFMYVDSNHICQYDIRLQKITKSIFAPGADVAREIIKNLDIETDDDESCFNNAMPVSFIANINSPSHKEFIRHLQHNIQLARLRLA